jgi:hypothetical protein
MLVHRAGTENLFPEAPGAKRRRRVGHEAAGCYTETVLMIA